MDVLKEFTRAEPKGNLKEQSCQHKENPVLSNSFTQIYNLFVIGVRIGPPLMHIRFHISCPKINKRFCIGPPIMQKWFCIGPVQFFFNLLPPGFHRR